MPIRFITGNVGKFEEVAAVIPGLARTEFDLPEIQGTDPRLVVEEKLRAAAAIVGGGCLVEDTSLHLDCLGGLPGPLVKWFEIAIGIRGIADLAARAGASGAEARSVLGYAAADGAMTFFEGVVRGRIVPPRGDKDFGWGPIFVPDGQDLTYAEMDRETKRRIGQRGAAARKLKAFLDSSGAAAPAEARAAGRIHILTGNGKGKTTSALGVALRAAGAGLPVAIVQFDKGGDHYSERRAISDALRGRIEIIPTGLDRIDPDTGRFRFGATEGDLREAARGLDAVRGLFRRQDRGLVILDELCTAVSLGLLDEAAALAVLREKPASVELVITGRGAPESFLAMADLVTEMRLVKHYFYRGDRAREGIDW